MEECLLDWVNRATARQILGIKETQLRIDIKILSDIETPGFDYRKWNDKGFGKTTFQALLEFRKLVKLKGRSRAIAEINLHMESLNNERERQASS